MHNASTKQRLAALRRKFGIWTSLPGWVREKRDRLVAALTPAPLSPQDAMALGLATPLPASVGGPLLAASVSTPPGRTPGGTGSAGTPAEDPTTLVSPSGVYTAPPTTLATATPGPAGATAPSKPFERVMEPTPPLPDVRAQAAVPASSRRWQGVAAGVVAAVVLAVLAWLALVPWLRTRAPAEEPQAAAAATIPAPAPVPAAAPAPTPMPAPAAGTVEVRRGDTLWHLSAAHLGDPLRWPELHRANRAIIRDPDLIYPGQALQVPSR